MRQYVVDAFTDRIFGGNPAAVCVMEKWPDEKRMQDIARENSLSETAFAVKENNSGRYKLRWFTPEGEIDLCGHATLGTASVILNFTEPELDVVVFDTMSEQLTVRQKEDLYEMEFPSYQLRSVEITDSIIEALGAEPSAAFLGRDLLCVFEEEQTVRELNPNPEKIRGQEGLLLHVTAPGTEYDCVSRSFAPKLGIAEDPVCGSGHCHIAPYWMELLKKDMLTAYQASPRGGVLYCRREGEKLFLSGKTALYSIAELYLPE